MNQQEIDDNILIAERKLEDFLQAEFPDVEKQCVFNFVDDVAPNWMDKGVDKVIEKLSDFAEQKKQFDEYRKLKGF